jgi:hypothetical protein
MDSYCIRMAMALPPPLQGQKGASSFLEKIFLYAIHMYVLCLLFQMRTTGVADVVYVNNVT